MAWNTQPRHPTGSVPRRDYHDMGDIAGTSVGLITRVDEFNMKADVKILTGGGHRLEVDLTQAMAGPRSFWGGVPEVNAICVLGYRRIHKNLKEAVILGYLPVGNRSGLRFDPFSAANPSEVLPEDQETYQQLVGSPIRYKRLLMHPGDVGGMSSSGSELVLSKDVSVTNRAGDLFELRDAERTLVTQAVHRVQAEAGVRFISGPARRGAIYFPPDVFVDATASTLVFKNEAAGYYGQDDLQNLGPGNAGESYKFCTTGGQANALVNDIREFPAVTLPNGKRVHYPPTLRPDLGLEDPNSPADAFVEHRLEISHSSDLVPEVIEQIDGFSIDSRPPYIERVYGTIIGNDLTSSRGQRQYGKVLKPRVFEEFTKAAPGKFSLSEIDRTNADESTTAAGAFLFRIRPPRGRGDNQFVMAVTKEGKALINIPASGTEDYSSGSSQISAEMNLAGALKAYIGASTPDRISAHITLAGGLHLDIGRDATGNVITTNFKGAVRQSYTGVPNEEDAALTTEVAGVKKTAVTGAENKYIQGAKYTTVSGRIQRESDREVVNAHSGYSLNTGELNQLVSGKSQLNYALAVLENIVAGGKVSTILAGGLTQTVAAGAMAYTVAAGASTFNNPAGAFTITVGTGALSATTSSGAVTLTTGAGAWTATAGGGAMTLTSGLAMNLTAGALASILGPTINLGGSATPGVLGVCRGSPALPPNVPTLDPFTGIPLMGAATVMSS